MGGRDALVEYVGRIPAPVLTKLLAAFLLIVPGTVGGLSASRFAVAPVEPTS